MSDSTVKVWVRTDTIDKLIHGKSKSSRTRAIPDANVAEDDDVQTVDWGWARGTIVSSDKKGQSDDILQGNASLTVVIEDVESEHNLKSVEIPANDVKDGGMVMDNMYGESWNDEEDDDDYDDYGGGAPKANKPCIYPDDLIELTHLHEPAVVYCLRRRYMLDKIYTSTGPILLALNPFKHCKDIYSDDVMKEYWNRGEQSMGSGGEEKKSDGGMESGPLPPHVYAIADYSFRSMMIKLEDAQGGKRPRPGETGCNQSILVSGESGAGKTVTTKFIMKYLATLSNRKKSKGKKEASEGGVEQQVLQSNPILESFGNARTIRNDNSSRFGKFIEMQFTSKGNLVGASIETYLLEKVRLVTQTSGERNYHIFYEMLAGFSDEDFETYQIGDCTVEDFKMTSASDTYDRRDGVDDFDTYKDLLDAMDTMGFKPDEQQNIFTVTCACLHASNLEFCAISADECKIEKDNPNLDAVLSLMGVTYDDLNQALCYFKINARGEKYTRSVPKAKAEKGIEAFIKAFYGALFTYLVQRVNSSITMSDARPRRGEPANKVAASIGVLDIFGFESFKKNSFEQLCINYCNEVLQQQFNLFVLKNEQDEYTREGIQWSFISFPENQDVIDLISKKGSGLLPILDDQCKAPGTTDKTFANDIYTKCTSHVRFEANFRQVGALKFGIIHYAGLVEYDTNGFVEKNKDELPREATDLLASSKNKFVCDLAVILSAPAEAPKAAVGRGRAAPRGRAAAGAKSTVGSQFSKQLTSLRQKIDLTSPHYVRCLKPNDLLVPDHFDPLIISDQLRCAGVIEAVRVSRVGYSQRYSHSMFSNRYRILGLKAMKGAMRAGRKKPVNALVEVIGQQIWEMEDADNKKKPVDFMSIGIQVGKTKVFLRRKAFDVLERLRNVKLSHAAFKMQAIGRMYLARRDYKDLRNAALMIQSYVRGIAAGKVMKEMKRNRAAERVQTAWRRHVHRKVYISTLYIAKWVQRMQRGKMGRKRYTSLNHQRKSIIIQKYVRGCVLSKIYQQQKKSSHVIQCAIRCYYARMALKLLKAEAKDFRNVAKERDELRNEMQKVKREMEKLKATAKKGEAAAALANKKSEQSNSIESQQMENMSAEMDKLKLNLKHMTEKSENDENRAKSAEEKLQNQILEAKDAMRKAKDKSSNCTALEAEVQKLTSRAEIAEAKLEAEQARVSTAMEKSQAIQSRLDASMERVQIEKKRADAAMKQVSEEKALTDSAQQRVTEEKTRADSAEQRAGEYKIRADSNAQVPERSTRTVPIAPQSDLSSVSSEELEKVKKENVQLKTKLEVATRVRQDMEKNLEEMQENMEHIKANTAVNHSQPPTINRSQPPTINHSQSPTIQTVTETQYVQNTEEFDKLNTEFNKLKEELEEMEMALVDKINEATQHKSERCAIQFKFDQLKDELKDQKQTISRMAFQANSMGLSHRANNALNKGDIHSEEFSSMCHEVNQLRRELEETRSKTEANVCAQELEDAKNDIEIMGREIDYWKKLNIESQIQISNNASSFVKSEEFMAMKSNIASLEKELKTAKLAANPDSEASMSQRYDELKRLIEACMDKDREISVLREQMAQMKEDICRLQGRRQFDEDASYDSLGSPTTSKDIFPVANARSALKKLTSFRMEKPQSNKYRDELSAEDASALRAVNEMLRSELEAARKELEDANKELAVEQEKSQKDLVAFSEALNGVDELRRSAEMMSQELQKYKNQNKRNSMLGYDDEDDDDSSVFSMATSALHEANQVIAHSKMQSTINPIWGKLRTSFSLGGGGRQAAQQEQELNRPSRRTFWTAEESDFSGMSHKSRAQRNKNFPPVKEEGDY